MFIEMLFLFNLHLFCIHACMFLLLTVTFAWMHLINGCLYVIPVLVLNEVDKLSREAQHSLRRTMEKYSASCRLILCCNSSSKVTEAVRSRCLNMRVNAPTEEQVCWNPISCLEMLLRYSRFLIPKYSTL